MGERRGRYGMRGEGTVADRVPVRGRMNVAVDVGESTVGHEPRDPHWVDAYHDRGTNVDEELETDLVAGLKVGDLGRLSLRQPQVRGLAGPLHTADSIGLV